MTKRKSDNNEPTPAAKKPRAPAGASRLVTEAAETGQLAMVKWLAKVGVNVNKPDKNGWTPLYAAVYNGHLRVVEWLVKNGAEVNQPDYYGNTPVSIAAQNGNLAMVECLARGGADVNLPDKEGRTPVSFAAWEGDPAVVACLVRNGADVNLPDKDGKTPLCAAALNGCLDVVRYLYSLVGPAGVVEGLADRVWYLAVADFLDSMAAAHRAEVERVVAEVLQAHVPELVKMVGDYVHGPRRPRRT